jgi:hypothetical protein
MMLTKFWESTGEQLAGSWIQQLFGPAILFWGGGLLIVIFDIGFYKFWNWISSRDIPTLVVILITGILVINLSGQLMKQLRFGFLRFLEGYWQGPFKYFMDIAINLQRQTIESNRDRWNTLMNRRDEGVLSPSEKRELSNLEVKNHYTPADLRDCLPTTLGNIILAAESSPEHKYGLGAVICWPRLWMLIPTHAREDLTASRERLDILVELWAWGLFFLVWASLWPWAIAISVLWVLIIYSLITDAARTYADLLESSFDLYRWELYKTTRWPLPLMAGNNEVITGGQLNQFLWRGYTETSVTYTKPEA